MPFSFSPLPHKEAVARIAGLPLVTRAVLDGMLPELKAYAFTITGLDVGDQMAKARDAIAAVPGAEKTWAEAKKEIAAELSESLGGKEAERRAELLLRTHTFRGYAATRYRTLMEQRDVFPYWQYKTHGDGNVRPAHAALNGKIFPAGHDIWQRIFPPWDWGCRCLVVPLTKGAVGRMTNAEGRMTKQDNDGTLAPTQIVRPEVFTEREATLIDKSQRLPGGVPLNHSQTWAAAPWSAPGTVKHDWHLIKERYADQPEVLAAFRAWAGKTTLPDMGEATVLDWLEAENSRGFFRDISTPGSAYVRGRQNIELRNTRPPRKAPVSAIIDITIKDPDHASAAAKAKWLVDHAHDDGRLGRVTVSDKVRGGKDAVGSYWPEAGAVPAQIGVHKDAAQPVLATLHEVGHHVRPQLDPKGVAEVARLARATRAAQVFVKLDLDPDYWLADNELFARSYAQWVVEKTGDAEALRELADITDSGESFRQFPDEKDWLPVRKALESLLRKQSWL